MNFTAIILLALSVILAVHSVHGVKYRSLKKQCTDQGFTAGVCSSSTAIQKNTCTTEISCAVVADGKTYKQSGGKVPDGSPCPDGKRCVGGKCTATQTEYTSVGETGSVKCDGGVVPTAKKVTKIALVPLSP